MFDKSTNKLITRAEASEKYRRSETTLWRDERDGLIPPAIKIRKRKFWVESQLDEAYGLKSAEDSYASK